METVHLSEEPVNDYEEIIVQEQPTRRKVVSRETRYYRIAGVVFCVAASASMFIAIVVELVNAFKDNPYL